MSTPVQSARPIYIAIHFSTVFDGRTPVLCGVNEIPKPATDDWVFVTCRRCLVVGARTSHVARAELARRDAERAAQRAANEG